MSVRIYACGGAGMNACLIFNDKALSPGYADIHIANINTTDNDCNGQAADNVYLIPELDGSGGVRGKNAELIKGHTPNILSLHQPEELNIIVSAGGGATGAVATYFLAEELIKQGHNTIIVTIGCYEATHRTKNTISNMLSLHNLPKVTGQVVNVVYFDNRVGIGAVNDAIRTFIAMMAGLYCGTHQQLDTADLTSFLQPAGSITGIDPCIAVMTVFKGSEAGNALNVRTDSKMFPGNLCNLISLYPQNTVPAPNQLYAFYSKTGFADPDTNSMLRLEQGGIHFATMTDVFEAILDQEENNFNQQNIRLQAAKSAAKATRRPRSNGDGLIIQ